MPATTTRKRAPLAKTAAKKTRPEEAEVQNNSTTKSSATKSSTAIRLAASGLSTRKAAADDTTAPRRVKPKAIKAIAVKTIATKSVAAKKNAGKSLPAKAPGVKARRVRAPKDLAIQYGEKTKNNRAAEVSTAAKNSRRDAAARQKIKEMMAPGDEVLARLARAGMIASALAPELNESNGHARRASVAKRRPRVWEFRCGKCGALSTFKTAAALCAKCGAIAVRA